MKVRFFLVMTVLVCARVWAASPNNQQYIVKLKHLSQQPNANAAVPIKDAVTRAGGHVDAEWWDRLIVTLPDNAVDAIAKHVATKYLQLVRSGPTENSVSSPSSSARSSAIENPLPSDSTKHLSSTSLRPIATAFSTWDSGTYAYDGSGNITAIGNDSFTYDSLSRLSTASVKGNAETYMYDSFGNLTSKTTTPAQGTPLTIDLATTTATNHLAAQAYDTAGNLTGNGGETNYYDSFNMMRRKDVSGYGSEYYVYNANDERIAVVSGCTTSTQPNCNNALVTVSARDEEGKVLRQFDVPYPWFSTQAWSWVEDYVYREGQFLAAERPAAEGGRRHFHLDHLGSPRLVTGPSGQQVAAHDYYPFGVEITPLRQETTAGLDREDPMKFTGHERDFNIGTLTENSNYNDYMHARFTTPQWGRFLSVDPKLDVEKTIQAPQWWNRYSYALNNPLRYTDPDGREVTITIKRDTYTSESVTATIEVKSDVKGVNSFSGFTLETTHAGDSGTKDPIPAGTYDASVRTDHTPNRVELQNVPGYDNVQIHVGNTKDDVKGCFAAGTTRTTDTVAESKSAMTSILAVISNDNSGIIKVTVEGSPTKPPPPPVKPPVKP